MPRNEDQRNQIALAIPITAAITSSRDLTSPEKQFLTAMKVLAFGFFENIPISDGELVLQPWPTTVRTLKLDGETSTGIEARNTDFTLRTNVIEFFQQVRSIPKGCLRRVVVRHGLPAVAELETSGRFCAPQDSRR